MVDEFGGHIIDLTRAIALHLGLDFFCSVFIPFINMVVSPDAEVLFFVVLCVLNVVVPHCRRGFLGQHPYLLLRITSQPLFIKVVSAILLAPSSILLDRLLFCLDFTNFPLRMTKRTVVSALTVESDS